MNGLYGEDLGIHRGVVEVKNEEELEAALIHPNKRAVQRVSINTCSDATLSNLIAAFSGGNLTHLELCRCNFFNFPKKILALTSLTKLSLRQNSIMLLHHDLTRLRALESLDIGQNSLLSLSPSLLKLQNLRSLDVSYNQIESIAYGLDALSNLAKLCCSSNRISILPIGLICKPAFDFEFANNPIVFPPDNIMNLGADAVIKLCSALLKVAMLHSETEANLSGLQLCSLPHVLLPGILHVSNFANIKVLDLSHNMIDTAAATSAIASNLSIFSALSTLVLDFNILLELPQLQSTTNFSRLSFRRNSIMQLIPERICSQANLTELFLSHNRISEIPDLTALKSLRLLELHGNPIREVQLATAMHSSILDGTIDSQSLIFPNVSCPSFPIFSEVFGQTKYSLREIFMCVRNISLKTSNHLSLPGLGITVSPHVNLFNKQQTCLDLSNNMIRDLDASLFTSASCLTDIDMSCNHLSNTPALEHIISLIQLKRLNLANNQLTKYIFHHSTVVHIDLSHNSIDVIPISAFESWTSLVFADFSSNHLCQFGIATSKSDVNRWNEIVYEDQQSLALNQLPLEMLILSNNGLFGSLPLVFVRLRALLKLDFSDTYLSDIPPLFWRIFEDLTPESASFSRCPLSHVSVQIFESYFLDKVVEETESNARRTILQYGLPRGFRASQILDCCGMAQKTLHLDCSNLQLTDLPKPCLIMNLTILDVSGNCLLNLPPEVFEMVNLQTLNIAKNDFVVLSERVSKLSKLQCLDIYDTNINELPYALATMPCLQSLTWQPAELTRLEVKNRHAIEGGRLPLRIPPASVFFGGWANAKLFMNQIINSQSSHVLELCGINLPSLPLELARIEFSGSISELTVTDCILAELPGWFSRFSMLTYLDLSNNKLARLPDNIDVLTSISHLDLSSNPLLEPFPALAALSNLVFLNLCRTETKILHPSTTALVRLKTLALQNTKVSVIPGFVSKLVCLEALLLDGCHITSISWTIGHCPKLRELQCKSSASAIETPHKYYVSLGSAETLAYMKLLCRAVETGEVSIMHTNIESFPEEMTEILQLKTLTLLGIKLKRVLRSISRLKNLEELNVAQNVLPFLPDELGQLHKLQELDVSMNLLTTLPDALANCTCLTTLQLSDNKFQEWPPCVFELVTLETLSFSNNRLEHVPEGVAKLTALKQLFLQHNALFTVSSAVQYLRSLEAIDLSHTNLSTISVHFGACPLLRRIRRVDLPLLETKLARMSSLSDGDFIKELRILYNALTTARAK